MVTDSSNSPLTDGVQVGTEKMKWRDLDKERGTTYSQIKKKFTSEASRGQTSFVLSELVASQLSVEEEEKNRFEKRVNDEVENRMSVLKSEAQQKGFAQGQEEGKKQAYEEEKARLAALLEKTSLSAKELSEAKVNLATQYETVLVDLAFRIAEVVLHAHIDERPESVRHAIRAVLERISRDDDVRIKLDAHAFEGISEIQEDLKSLTRDGRLTFELDASLPKGACVVESQSGEYASFVEEKITGLRNEINQKIADEQKASGEEQKVG